MEKLELEKQKILLEFDSYKQATHEVGSLMEKCEENASIRAEFELAKKVQYKCLLKGRLQIKLITFLDDLKHAGEIEESADKT